MNTMYKLAAAVVLSAVTFAGMPTAKAFDVVLFEKKVTSAKFCVGAHRQLRRELDSRARRQCNLGLGGQAVNNFQNGRYHKVSCLREGRFLKRKVTVEGRFNANCRNPIN